jgi:hypothetical protein
LTATVHKLTEQVSTLQEYINQLIKEE